MDNNIKETLRNLLSDEAYLDSLDNRLVIHSECPMCNGKGVDSSELMNIQYHGSHLVIEELTEKLKCNSCKGKGHYEEKLEISTLVEILMLLTKKHAKEILKSLKNEVVKDLMEE